MARVALLPIVAVAVSMVRAQSGTTTSLEPLASKHFTYPNIPYQVTGDQGGIRGPQFGYNLCNSTTENQSSLCQTSFLNSLDDFCMWSSSQTDDTVGESEAREVAWCTKPGHGTRVIPPGALQGAQFLYAKNYLQVVGFIDQTKVGLDPTDEGGELDPHGADEQGNPLGGIVFTNGFGQNSAGYQSQFKANSSGSQTFTQVIEWIDFIGGGIFCLKMCNPSDPNAAELCQHVYDEIGCNWNALADYGSINGTFSVCDSDDMTPPGVFTAPNGQLTTWFQPLNGPITTIPYTTTIPSSSNCVTYQSTDLYAAAASAIPTTSSGSSTATTTSGASSSTGTSSSKSGSSSSSSGSTSRTGSSTSSQPTNTSSSGALSINSAPLAVGALTGLALIMSIFA